MRKQIQLIALVVFSIAILLGSIYSNTMQIAEAVTITSVTFGATGVSNEWRNCEYLSSTEVWCPTTTGIKIWNPTSRTVTATLLSAYSWNDIKCTSSACYAWDVVSTGTGNLTMIDRTTRTLLHFQPFIDNAGGQVGHGIGLLKGGDNTVLVGAEGQTCTQGVTPLGNADEKGVCLWQGGVTIFDGVRFITSGSTNDLDVIYDIEWNEGTGLFGNRALVKYRNLAGTFLWQLLNLSDGDTTFATNRICETASLTGTTQQSKMVIISGKMYDAYSTSDLLVMDTTVDTCAVAIKTNLVDETVIRTTTYDSTNNVFIISATTNDGGSEQTAVYTFNGTTLSQINTVWNKLLKVNTTGTTDVSWSHFNHPSEGEIHAWQGSVMLIISDLIGSIGGSQSGSTVCIDTTGDTVADLCFTDTNGDGVADNGVSGSLGVYRSNTNITSFGNDVFCAFGINQNACTNKDVKTNGVGGSLLAILILISYAFLVSIHIFAQQQLGKQGVVVMHALTIHAVLILVMLIIDTSVAFQLGWIDSVIYYTVIVVMIGLAGFGFYRVVRGGN